MLVAAVQIVLGLFSLFLRGVLAAPPHTSSGSANGQVILAETFKKDRKYEHGELPPMENTLGWIDPRLNGGRFIDVRSLACLPHVHPYELRCCSIRVTNSGSR